MATSPRFLRVLRLLSALLLSVPPLAPAGALVAEAALLGPDADGNGVRDDLDAFIAAKVGSGGRAAGPLSTYARSLGRGLLRPDDEEAARGVLAALVELQAVGEPGWTTLAAEVRARTVDTKARLDAYAAFQARAASVFTPLASPAARSLADCTAPCTVVVFQNGILTTEETALENVRSLQALLGAEPDGHPLLYALNYNPTEGLNDFVEVFMQKFGEHPDPTAAFARSLVDPGLLETVARDLLVRKLEAAARPPSTVAGLLGALRNPASLIPTPQQLVPTPQDVTAAVTGYAAAYRDTFVKVTRDLRARTVESRYDDPKVRPLADTLDGLLRRGLRVVLVAHSQGNLYADVVHRELRARGTPLERFRIVGVAVPNDRAPGGGEYVTSGTDLVIGALGLIFGVLAPNDASVPPLSAADLGLGHNFGSVYTNGRYGVATAVRDAVRRAIADVNR